MRVSVVICMYALDLYDDLAEAVESVLGQTYDDVEIVVVVDGNRELFDRVEQEWGGGEDVRVHCNEENQGVSYSRTYGAELATGDVVAFIDDDAIAEPDWVAELVRVYEERDALAVGGKMVGQWVAGRPWFLPEEFYWLVGVTHRGFAEDGDEVRNTFESNLSFRRDVFLELGGFDSELGPTAEEYSHSEGAELGTRLQAAYGRGVVYTADAVVRHKVFEERRRFGWLCRRAFEQGVSKRRMARRTKRQSSTESAFLRALFFQHTPRRVRELVASPTISGVAQLLMLFVFTTIVGVGYLFESARKVFEK